MLKQMFAVVVLGLACCGAFARSVLIDVRTAEEFAAGHLDGALNISHEQIGQRIGMAGVSKDDEIVLYCRSGQRAGIAAETLTHLGFKHVQNYGGMDDARKKLCSLKPAGTC